MCLESQLSGGFSGTQVVVSDSSNSGLPSVFRLLWCIRWSYWGNFESSQGWKRTCHGLLEPTTSESWTQLFHNWKEALTVVSAVKEFYPYLYRFHFKLVNDYNPLTALNGVKDYGKKLTCWMLFLMEFDYEMEYKPGRTHSNADTLSCLPSGHNVVNVIQDIYSVDNTTSLSNWQTATANYQCS